MGLPTSITVFDSGGASSTFDDKVTIGRSAVYHDSSGYTSLDDRPHVRVAHETRKSGITSSLLQVVKPLDDDANGNARAVTCNLTIIRDGDATFTEVEDVIAYLVSCLIDANAVDFDTSVIHALSEAGV